MDKAISLFIEVFTKNPLTVTLAVLGAICVVLAIVGRIPPMDIRGIRAVILGLFGAFLIGVAITLAWLLAASPASQPQPEPITNTQHQTPSTEIRPTTATQKPVAQPTAPSPADVFNCGFFTELLKKSQVNQNLMGSRGLAGVQARLIQPVDVPVGWTVHIEGVEYKGPIRLEAGTFASFWASYQCEPLKME